MKTFDIIVIGSGGGSKITSPAAQMGFRVAVVEKDALGGTCLNRGCIPSKMLIQAANVAFQIKNASKYDIHNAPPLRVDFKRLISRISDTVDRDSAGIEAAYAKNPNIDHYKGIARFVSNRVVDVDGERLTADRIFIAVGSRPHIPPVPGLAGSPFMTSTEALRNTTLPKSMIVIGAGYIAVELGHAYGALGTDVHFVVRSRFLKREDPDIAEEFTRVFSEQYHVHMGATPAAVDFRQGLFRLRYKTKDGAEKDMTAEALLVAVGVVPNSDTLELENTDIRIDDKGFIVVDEGLQTTVEGVYALGDCIGRFLFRHTVNFEGEYLFRRIFVEKSNEPIVYPPVPHAIFTYPQIAGVGNTEDELRAEGTDYVAGTAPYHESGMGMALLSDHGFVKILIDRKTQRILGAHIIGPEASDMIHMLIALITKGGTLDDVLGMIYIHPALPELLRNAGRAAKAELSRVQETGTKDSGGAPCENSVLADGFRGRK